MRSNIQPRQPPKMPWLHEVIELSQDHPFRDFDYVVCDTCFYCTTKRFAHKKEFKQQANGIMKNTNSWASCSDACHQARLHKTEPHHHHSDRQPAEMWGDKTFWPSVNVLDKCETKEAWRKHWDLWQQGKNKQPPARSEARSEGGAACSGC